MKGSWNSRNIIPITFSFNFIFFIFQAVFSDPTTRHLCRPEQRDTLLKFKNEFKIGKCFIYGIDTHPKTVSWTNTSDCCNWEGIKCDAKLKEVIELNLSSSCLHGRFQSNNSFLRLQNFHFLTTLDLSFNNLTGQVPFSIGNLSPLITLQLYFNQFSGPIPSSIGKLSHLTTLDLSSNQFSGQIPSFIGILYDLRDLDLSSNNFSSQIPSSFGNLSFLTSLIISNNKFTGQVPSWLWTLPKLEYLDLSNNSFIGFESSAKHGQSSIRKTSIMKNFFGSNNNFTDTIPSFICALQSLIILDLSDNNFNGSIPSCIGNLKSNLSVLNLRQNRLSGGIPRDTFKSLRSLDVSHNQLVGKLPRSLINFSSLEVLKVESNKINDTFPFWLSSLKELKVLVICSNLFHGPIHQASFAKLRIIDIAHNHFSGTLSSDYFLKWDGMSSLGNNEDKSKEKYMGLGYYYHDSMVFASKGVELELSRILKIYRAIDFSGNKIEGEIPWSIGVLKELHVLNLTNNAFSGHIPSSMGNLTALESLDVSQNKLSGDIPQELGKLSYLAYMNFSHNQLRGLVPGGTQFRTQPCSSFEDNMGLFGPSLDEACQNIDPPESKKTLESEEEEEEEDVISWMAVAISFGPSLVFGLTVGYISGFQLKRDWFIKYIKF